MSSCSSSASLPIDGASRSHASTTRPATTKLVIQSQSGQPLGTYVGPTEMQFTWAPDSSRLAVLADATDSVFIGPDGERLGPLSLPDGWATSYVVGTESTSWSPGRTHHRRPWMRGALACVPKSDLQFLLVAVDGSGSHLVDPEQPGSYAGGSVVWAPDSRLAAFRGDYATIVASDGAVLHRLTLPAWTQVRGAAWSPDGTRLAVTDNVGAADQAASQAEGEIWIIGPDGTSRVLPMDPAYALGDVAWSEDGRSLLFNGSSVPPTANDVCCSGLWTIDAAGGHQRLLIDNVSSFVITGPPISK